MRKFILATVLTAIAAPLGADVFIRSALTRALADSLYVRKDTTTRQDMLGALGHPDGTAALPSMTFANETGLGFSRLTAQALGISSAGVARALFNAGQLQLKADYCLGWSSGLVTGVVASDTFLCRGASAGIVAQRSGTTAQTYEVYRTYTSASQYARLSLGWSGTDAVISAAAAGGETAGQIILNLGGSDRWRFTTAGSLIPISNLSSAVGSPAAALAVVYTGALVPVAAGVTIADNGGGTPAASTITPTSTTIHITCSDANGCDVTMGEASVTSGHIVTLVNLSANVVNFADSAGVSELAGAFAAGQYDSISMSYVADRWVETSRSNN